MKNDKVLETFVPKHDREVRTLSDMSVEELDELLDELKAVEYGKASDAPKRSLKDIKIGDQLAPLTVDPKYTIGHVEEPDKNIDWKDVREKD